MPISANAFTKSEQEAEYILLDLMDYVIKKMLDGTYYAIDGKHVQMAASCKNIITKEDIVRVIFTIIQKGNERSIVDTNIISKKEHFKKLYFANKIRQEKEGYAFYDVKDEDGRLYQVQTVNDYVLDESIVKKTLEVAVTLLPFQIEVYDSIEQYNEVKGISNQILPTFNGNDTKEVRMGVGEDFSVPGTLVSGNPNEVFSMVLGKVLSARKCDIDFSGRIITCYYVEIKSGDGSIPVIFSTDLVNNQEIKEGDLLEIMGDLKVDLASGDNSYYSY